MKTKYGAILKDGFILLVVSTIFVISVNYMFKGLKKGRPADPLVTAITQGSLESVRDELGGEDSRERVNRAGDQGRTPLMWAAYANFSDEKMTAEKDAKRLPLAEYLLTSGADVSLTDQDGWTALMWAAWSGLPQVAGKLLDAGASVSVADAQGNTPLMVAALRGNSEIIRLLVSKGADTKLLRKDGKSARDLAEGARKAYPSREATYTQVLQLLGA